MKINGTMLEGQINLSITDLEKYPNFFPDNGEIIIDDGREAYVRPSTKRRVFIRGLPKQYLAPKTKIEIIKIPNKKREYRIVIVENNNSDNSATTRTTLQSTNKCNNIFEQSGLITQPLEPDVSVVRKTRYSVEDIAVQLFVKYLYENHPDRFETIVEDGKVVSDIRKCRKGYEGVFADYVLFDKIRKRKVFFEIKGTSKTDQYWGGVTFKELKSAIAKKDDYFFVIICTDNSWQLPFIHLKPIEADDPYSVFMTLDEFLGFSTRASLGIQFVIKYPNGENGELIKTKDGKNAYGRKELEDILKNEYIQKMIFDK